MDLVVLRDQIGGLWLLTRNADGVVVLGDAVDITSPLRSVMLTPPLPSIAMCDSRRQAGEAHHHPPGLAALSRHIAAASCPRRRV